MHIGTTTIYSETGLIKAGNFTYTAKFYMHRANFTCTCACKNPFISNPAANTYSQNSSKQEKNESTLSTKFPDLYFSSWFTLTSHKLGASLDKYKAQLDVIVCL